MASPCVYRYRKNAYLFIYYLIQFCGHSWILTNMTARFFSFGKGNSEAVLIFNFYSLFSSCYIDFNFELLGSLPVIISFSRVCFSITILSYFKLKPFCSKEKVRPRGRDPFCPRAGRVLWKQSHIIGMFLFGSVPNSKI